MKTLIPILALTLLPFVVSAEELRSIEVKAVSEAVFETSPKDSAYAGKRWMTRKFEIRNVSATDFFVHGHSLRNVFIDVLTKDPASGEWVSRGYGYCGTGARRHRVAPGEVFSVEVSLPVDLADREFVIQFTQYPDDPLSKGVEVKTPALRMKEAAAR